MQCIRGLLEGNSQHRSSTGSIRNQLKYVFILWWLYLGIPFFWTPESHKEFCHAQNKTLNLFYLTNLASAAKKLLQITLCANHSSCITWKQPSVLLLPFPSEDWKKCIQFTLGLFLLCFLTDALVWNVRQILTAQVVAFCE